MYLLVEAGVPPACGAALPGGPVTAHSACKAQGLMTSASTDGRGLHLNHEPPLTDSERGNRAVVCDPMRIELLCDVCHGRLASGGDQKC